MLHELYPPYSECIRKKFQPLTDFQPMCDAVLEGIYPGRVWGNDLDHPQTTFMSSYLNQGNTWCFLAGNPDNFAFNHTLNEAIYNKQLIPEYTVSMIFTCMPENWFGRIATIFKPREPILMIRRHYIATVMNFNWRERIPAGFTLLPMEKELLEETDLLIPNEVQETLHKWRTIPNLEDFGVVIRKENEIVAWATIDFVANRTGDIGFFTNVDYRRRGLATIAAAAAIEQGLSRKLAQISWTCSEYNIGSIRTAEKLGLTIEREYTSFWFILDEASHLAQLAYTCLQNSDYHKTIRVYDQYLKLVSDPPIWAYYDLARAYGGQGELKDAMRYLQTAIDKGWKDVDELNTCKEFIELRRLPEWERIIQNIDNI